MTKLFVFELEFVQIRGGWVFFIDGGMVNMNGRDFSSLWQLKFPDVLLQCCVLVLELLHN